MVLRPPAAALVDEHRVGLSDEDEKRSMRMKERASRSRGRMWIVSAMLVIGAFGGTTAIAAALSSDSHSPCNVTVNSENSQQNSLQSAINSANPGWTICVGAGSFPEQIVISTPSLKILGAGAAKTSIDPSAIAATTVDWDSSGAATPLAAVVLVDNTTGVTLSSLTVSAAGAVGSIPGCGTDISAVDYQNSSGTVTSVTATGTQLPPSLLGCQNQLDVYAYNGWFNTGFVPFPAHVVTIVSSTVTSYGKNGITCDDPGLTCAVTSSTVSGLGGTSATAQNGIQVAYGALGTLSKDHVSGDNYTGGTSTLDWYGTGYQASGILLYGAASGTSITGCTLSGDAEAIADYAPSAATLYVTGNTITGATGYGIVVNGAPGSETLIANNTVNSLSTGAPGILVDNGTFNVSGNKLSYASAAGTNGPSQTVCGTGSYLSCPTTLSIATAAIQAVSEGSGGPTSVTLFGNSFTRDSLSLATLALPTGSVETDWT